MSKIYRDSMKSVVAFFTNFNSGKLASLMVACFTIMVESQLQLLILLLLVAVDFITGINKSLDKHRVSKNPFKKYVWRIINSSGMRETWNKGYQYGLGILIAILIQSAFFKEGIIIILEAKFSLVKVSILTLCGIEIYSIFENIRDAHNPSLIEKIEKFISRWSKVFQGKI